MAPAARIKKTNKKQKTKTKTKTKTKQNKTKNWDQTHLGFEESKSAKPRNLQEISRRSWL